MLVFKMRKLAWVDISDGISLITEPMGGEIVRVHGLLLNRVRLRLVLVVTRTRIF